jgi:hypothetical protein
VNHLLRTYCRAVSAALSLLQSPMLLSVRLYWGFQPWLDGMVQMDVKCPLNRDQQQGANGNGYLD